MKWTITIFSFLFFAFQASGQSSVSNLGFENWSSGALGNYPTGFPALGSTENDSDPYEGNSALRLEVYEEAFISDTLAAAASGEFVGNSDIAIGVPYTECPDSLTGYVRHDLLNQDTAGIMAMVWSGNDTMATAEIFFDGEETDWTRFSMAFQPSGCNGMTPDSIGILITAEMVGLDQYLPGVEDRGTQSEGSIFEVDGLSIDTMTTSLEEHDASRDPEFKVQPNPARERILFDFDRIADRVRIFDMTGRNVRSVDMQNSSRKEVNVSGLEEGMYIYRVENARGKELHTDKLQLIR